MPTGSQEKSGTAGIASLESFVHFIESTARKELEDLSGSSSTNSESGTVSKPGFMKLMEALRKNDSSLLADLFHHPSAAGRNIPELRQLKHKLAQQTIVFTQNLEEVIGLISALDKLFLAAEDRIREEQHRELLDVNHHLQHFNNRVTNSIPGIIFILDLFKFKEVYVNRNAEYFFGYSHEDLQEIGSDLMSMLIHPDDIPVLLNKVGDFSECKEGDIRIYEFRLKTKSGSYSWVRSYESVYMRTDTGVPRQVIGIAIDITREKETQSILAKREQQLLQAQQTAGIGSFEIEVDSYTGKMSDLAMDILDLQQGESLSQFIENVHPDDQARVRATITDAIDQQGSYDLEFRYKAEAGFKAIWLKGNVKRDNASLLLSGTVMDTTSRYNLLQQMRKSEQLYKQAEALSHIGNWYWNIEDDTVFWSDELYRIFGINPDSGTISYDRYLSLIHPDDKADFMQAIKRSLNTLQPFQVDHRVIVKNGAIIYIHAWGEVMVDQEGQARQLFGTAQDVTEKQLLLEQLKRSENLYKEAQYLSRIGNWSWSQTNNSFLLSDEIYRILEIEQNEANFSGEDLLKKVFPADQSTVKQVVHNAIREHGSFQFIQKYKGISGQLKFIKVLGEVRHDITSDSIEIIGTCQDITEQQMIEHQLRVKQAELEHSNTSLREYAYVASHDLQEPLRKISTFADRIRSSYQTDLPEPAKVYLDKIISSSVRMQQMVHDLLAVSIISSERSYELADLNKILLDVAQDFEDSMDSAILTIKSDTLPAARVIPSQMRQLFHNLISNSVKFRKPGIPVNIDVRAVIVDEPGDEVPDPLPDHQYLRLDFSDNGIGFNNQFSEKIFTIFQRLHRKQEYDGTGIGLAICKRIAENHNGMIRAFGEEGKGAIFTIIIPL